MLNIDKSDVIKGNMTDKVAYSKFSKNNMYESIKKNFNYLDKDILADLTWDIVEAFEGFEEAIIPYLVKDLNNADAYLKNSNEQMFKIFNSFKKAKLAQEERNKLRTR